MKKVSSVDSLQLALNKSNPPELVVTATGTTNTAGWINFVLTPLWNSTHPPMNGVYAFSLQGLPPTGIVAQVLTPTGPVSYTFSAWETPHVKQVIVYATANHLEEPWQHPAKAPGAPAALPAPRIATGYSDKWDFGEAFRDAIKNLPPDPHPFPDKLYHFTVIHTGAEIGGIAGFNRMTVTVEG